MSEYIDLAKCILQIDPAAQFSINANDYEQINWFSEGQVPAKVDLIAVWPQVLANEQAKKDEAIAKKTAAIAKLEALGLDLDDLKALGLG